MIHIHMLNYHISAYYYLITHYSPEAMKNSEKTRQALEQMKQRLPSWSNELSASKVTDVNKLVCGQIEAGDTIMHGPRKIKPLKEFDQQQRKQRISKVQREKEMLTFKISQLSSSLCVLQKEEQSSPNRRIQQSRLTNYCMAESRIRQKSWRNQMAQRGQQIDQRKHRYQEKQNRRLQEQETDLRKSQYQETELRKQELKENVTKIQERGRLREVRGYESSHKIKQLKKNKKLFERLSEVYQSQEDLNLEEKKKKLTEIRTLHKPLDSEQLKSHQEKFQEIRRHRQEEREKEMKIIDERARSYKVPYESVYYKRYVEIDLQESRHASPNIRSKINEFSENVKEHHSPKIDQKKRDFFADIKTKEDPLVNMEERERLHRQMVKNKGFETMQFLRKLPKKAKVTPVDPLKPRYENYLVHSNSGKVKGKPWDTILNSSQTKQDKINQLKIECQKFEEKQKQKRTMNNIMKETSKEQFDKEYFDMVTAKIDLLNQRQ